MATVSSNINQTTSAFPYSLQPQPPPHPKTTGGKRGPSAPITIPSWARGEDDEEDSDHSITDHTPPTHIGRLANLDTSFTNSPVSTNGSPSTKGATVIYISNQTSSPRGLATTKKFVSGISSPRTLFNNNNAVALNLNHSVSSSPSAPASSVPVTTPILIIHPNNSSKANVVESLSTNHNSNNTVVSNTNLPSSGSNLFVPTNAIPANGNGLTTSHPPAPWVSSQSNGSSTNTISNIIGNTAKHGNLNTASTSLSKVPKLVDNPIQPKEPASGLSVKGQKGFDNHLPICSPLTSTESPCGNQASLTTTNALPVHTLVANRAPNNTTNTLVVGIPDHIVAPRTECAGATAPQLSPAEASSDGDAPVSSPTSSSSNSCFAYELDHDYENVASPCSSTASGPTYVRQPGFRHHAHEVTVSAGGSTSVGVSSSSGPNASSFSASLSPTGSGGIGSNNAFRLKKKKCSAMIVNFREGYKKREATPPKLKPKREPLPMKLRALPQSFWQQPNVAHQVSPATLFPILPPLPNKDTEETLMDVRPVTPPEEREAHRKSQPPERKLTVANTDLLFKLFDVVADDKKTSVHKARTQNKVPRKPIPKSNTKGLFLGNDPYMVDAVTEKIFPQLTLEAGSRSHGYQGGAGNSSLQLISLKEGDRTVQLPSLSMEQNYPQMLSELVMHI
ncbi:hypothetical protein ElyMa_003250300 [Elysia marginata]|uniref:Uncharacterized protein n=1 Tax=Elysia marginata TaxID=1093978 RepID=A0AAV4J503_9GAST|nr:hypothetical protein ElyMa_003250300 [Elysia marginata]